MADRRNIPNSPACGLWETLLADALDGLLRPEDEATFSSHMAVCPACTALFEEARQGREWLEFLSPEPEVPEGLLDKILAQTGPGHTSEYKLATAGNVVPMVIPAWQRPGIMGRIRRFAEPRLLMTAAMAFFSIALTLNMTGVRLIGPPVVGSATERGALVHGAPADDGVDANHSLLRSPAAGIRGGVAHARDAPQQRRSSSNSRLNRRRRGSQNKTLIGKMAGPAWILPQQSGAPSLKDSDYLETSVTLHERPAHPGGSEMAIREGSTVWTA